MTNWSYAVLLIAACAVLYTWIGYPAILFALGLFKRSRSVSDSEVPTVTIIVAVHNEEGLIQNKLEGFFALSYPADRCEIIVASDGSTDATEQIVQKFAARDSRVRLVRSSGRAGKSSVQNLAAVAARGEILLFTDAETTIEPDLLRRVGAHFENPRVGMVAPVVHFRRLGTSVSEGQGAYWRFELFLRQLESDLRILATCSGAAFAVRRDLFRPIPPQYGDDCVVPLDVRLQGYQIVQDPQIIVCDEMPNTIDGELRARIRMTARNWAGMLNRPGIFNPFRFPATAWGLVSHKFLRWLTPFFLTFFYLANTALVFRHEFILLFVAQNSFYVAALIGWRQAHFQAGEKIFAYPFAFCLANIGFFWGVVQWARGRRTVAYK